MREELRTMYASLGISEAVQSFGEELLKGTV